ncbi:PASTA domain-containing protein [Peptococcaceae bacterium]|nr:PASTA domain-containing protein [Peptococcaceae bacterium]MCL0052116.1 PASTA domain-containing protein [Peptococcaceae bacterium]
MQIEIEGSGFAKSQSIEAGMKVEKGSTVKVIFEPLE